MESRLVSEEASTMEPLTSPWLGNVQDTEDSSKTCHQGHRSIGLRWNKRLFLKPSTETQSYPCCSKVQKAYKNILPLNACRKGASRRGTTVKNKTRRQENPPPTATHSKASQVTWPKNPMSQ